MKKLLALAALGLALGLGACGFPPNDGQVHLGTAIHVGRHSDGVHVEICPPYCGRGNSHRGV